MLALSLRLAAPNVPQQPQVFSSPIGLVGELELVCVGEAFLIGPIGVHDPEFRSTGHY